MTYEELIKNINSEKTGIAKGYSINFLQDKFCFHYFKDSEDQQKIFNAMIAKDLEIFKTAEKVFLEAKEPIDGDFVEYDGKFAKISSCRNKNFQLSNKIGVYISKRGYSEASGCTWDPDINVDCKKLKFSNLTLTPKTKICRCWTFSEDCAGADRGVYYNISRKVWHLN